MKSIFKKIIVIMLLMFIRTNMAKAWIEVTYESDGESIPFSLPECVGNMEGCGYFTQDFNVRVTLVDKDNYVIPGTKTVGIKIFPADAPTDYEFHRHDYRLNKKSKEASLNGAWGQEEMFIGSNVAKLLNGSEEDYMELYANNETEVYAIPIPSSQYCSPDDWSCYSRNREAFFEAASNKRDADGMIYIDEIGTEISFLSFFLKKCGYTDVWNGLSDEETLNKMIEFVTDEDGNYVNELKLLIEPVYTVNVTFAGVDHTFTGTAKQLATMLNNSAPSDYLWFWPAIAMQNMYNLYNNMTVNTGNTKYDETIKFYTNRPYNAFNLLYTYQQELESMETYYETTMNGCQTPSGRNDIGGYGSRYGYGCTESKKQIERTRKKIEYIDRNGLYVDQAKSIFADIAEPYGNPHDYEISGMGISVIKVLGKDSTPIKRFYKNNCQFTITTCNNNKFEFSSKLSIGSSDSAGNIFDCIYPSDATEMGKEKMKNISVYNEENDLWCYDEVKYNFNDILSMNQKEYKTNQIINIPKGELTIDRTCFSKKNITSLPIGSINSLFETNTNNMYQKFFTLTLNGKNYTYKRDNTYTVNDNLTNISKLESKNKEEYYKYTTELKYTYSITEGYDVDSGENSGLNIGIKDYNFTNGLWNTKSINYETAYKGNAIVMKTKESGTYLNILSTEPNIIQTQLNQAFGLSNKLYKEITNTTAETSKEGNITVNEWKKTIAHDSAAKKWENIYTVTQKTGDSCYFETEVKGEDETMGNTQFRVISLTNPFPARDGTSRMPGRNWLEDNENNVYEYIQNNRGVPTEDVYNQEPIYKITLTTQTMARIREYNKSHSYNDYDMDCEKGTGRMCISNFIRNNKYINSLEGTCLNVKTEEITKYNNEIKNFRTSGCASASCQDAWKEKKEKLDTNKDGKVNELDYKNAEFYSCANKTAKSGG